MTRAEAARSPRDWRQERFALLILALVAVGADAWMALLTQLTTRSMQPLWPGVALVAAVLGFAAGPWPVLALSAALAALGAVATVLAPPLAPYAFGLGGACLPWALLATTAAIRRFWLRWAAILSLHWLYGPVLTLLLLAPVHPELFAAGVLAVVAGVATLLAPFHRPRGRPGRADLACLAAGLALLLPLHVAQMWVGWAGRGVPKLRLWIEGLVWNVGGLGLLAGLALSHAKRARWPALPVLAATVALAGAGLLLLDPEAHASDPSRAWLAAKLVVAVCALVVESGAQALLCRSPRLALGGLLVAEPLQDAAWDVAPATPLGVGGLVAACGLAVAVASLVAAQRRMRSSSQN
ncbi:MAG: hypothetical protein R3F59_37940 [Myxococcota bacterium]